MTMNNKIFLALSMVLFLFACSEQKTEGVKETRTSGTMTMLVDESIANIIDEEIKVFKSDYKNTKFTVINGSEGSIFSKFLNDSTRYIISTRVLSDQEEAVFKKRQIPVYTSRFAIDGIALITKNNSLDTNINVQELIDIMKGNGSKGKSLVFDNAYSSTLRYFRDLASVDALPKNNVYTLNNSVDVIKYVADNPGYIGVIGLNWYLTQERDNPSLLNQIMLMNVKNLPGKKGDSKYYKPEQDHIISGIYPLLRNIYVINAEGRDGLGTGFATWLTSNRGQLIVLKSGLAPTIIDERVINLKSK